MSSVRLIPLISLGPIKSLFGKLGSGSGWGALGEQLKVN